MLLSLDGWWSWTVIGVGSQTLRCHCCFDLYMATITDGPANLLVFASHTSNKAIDGLWFTFADQCEPDTENFGTSPEDVIILGFKAGGVDVCK